MILMYGFDSHKINLYNGRLLVLLALGLQLPRNFFLDKYDKPIETLRLLRYAPEVSDPNEGKFGAGKEYPVLAMSAYKSVG